jgi:hypothetical protein
MHTTHYALQLSRVSAGPIWLLHTSDYESYVEINVQKLASLNLVLRMTIMTPVKPQISKCQAEKSCQVGFNVLQWL